MFQNAESSDASGSKFAGGKNPKITDPIDFLESYKSLSDESIKVLRAFTQTRERIYEIQTAVVDTLPGIRRLGGDIGDVSGIISKVAIESRRNVIATSEEVEKLFAIEKTLGLGADVLSKNFLDVGLSIEKIPETLEESMNYVQSIGGNAKTVMKDVSDNMSQMNRYQFEGGVQGLTKMAAKASMLRFEMKETFALAEKVLDPEGAIEVAGAFQRLGVAAGNLVDPFQLMNMSINDPSGLQDSLADVAKQFTEFDADTKTFKINPQGVLTLREMERSAGLSAGSLSKMGLAASELDQRLSAVDAAGLTIASEEDKQYLANIAKMEDKKFKVTLEDGTKKELSELTQPEFDKLIDAQKNQPKTLEDTAKAQLRLDQILSTNVSAIRAAIAGGVLTAEPIQDLDAVLREAFETVVGTINEKITTPGVRDKVTEALGGLSGIKDKLTGIIAGGETDPGEILKELTAGAQDKLLSMGMGATEEFKTLALTLKDKLSGLMDKFERSPNTSATSIPTTSDTTSYGNISVLGQTGVNPNFKQGAVPTAPQKPVEVDGDIKVDVKFQNLPTSLTPEQIAEVIKTFNMAVNEQAFKNYIININRQESPYTSQGTPVY
jgi:hypothetical protein